MGKTRKLPVINAAGVEDLSPEDSDVVVPLSGRERPADAANINNSSRSSSSSSTNIGRSSSHGLDDEEKRRTDLERIPLKHYVYTAEELLQIDQAIQKRFRKEGALDQLVEKRKREAAAKSRGDDLVDTDEEV